MKTTLANFVDFRNKAISDRGLNANLEELRKYFPEVMVPDYLKSENDLVGIEVEVENIRADVLSNVVQTGNRLWSVKEDGSLRDNGIEFVTVPIFGSMVPHTLTALADALNRVNAKYSFSKRTSVHVHVNARTMSVEEVLGTLFIYTAVERLLYRWVKNTVGVDRASNIFCLPLNQTYYSRTIGSLLSNCLELLEEEDDYRLYQVYRKLVESWQKYLGINFGRSLDNNCGTIEFRHLSGTIDVKIISMWVGFLLKIKRAASKYSLSDILSTITTLNSNSEYAVYVDSIFEELGQELRSSNIQKHMEDNVSFIKECVQYSASREQVAKLEQVSTTRFNSSLFNANLQALGMVLIKQSSEKAAKPRVKKQTGIDWNLVEEILPMPAEINNPGRF